MKYISLLKEQNSCETRNCKWLQVTDKAGSQQWTAVSSFLGLMSPKKDETALQSILCLKTIVYTEGPWETWPDYRPRACGCLYMKSTNT